MHFSGRVEKKKNRYLSSLCPASVIQIHHVLLRNQHKRQHYTAYFTTQDISTVEEIQEAVLMWERFTCALIQYTGTNKSVCWNIWKTSWKRTLTGFNYFYSPLKSRWVLVSSCWDCATVFKSSWITTRSLLPASLYQEFEKKKKMV